MSISRTATLKGVVCMSFDGTRRVRLMGVRGELVFTLGSILCCLHNTFYAVDSYLCGHGL